MSLCTKILTPLLLLLLLPIGYLYFNEINSVKTELFYNDYGTFYESLRLAEHNQSLYKTYKIKITNPENSQTQRHLTNKPSNLNPPFFAFFIYPLGYLSYTTSLLSWLSLSIVGSFLAIGFIPQILAITKDRLFITAGLLVAFFAYYPTLINIQLGQLGLLLMPLIFFSWWMARTKKLVLCGILLGIATSIKIFFCVFGLYFLVRREWRSLGWFTGTILVCSLLPLTIFQFSEYLAYYKTLTHISWYTSSWNASLLGFLLRIFGGNREINTPLIYLPTLSHILHWVITGLLLVGLIKYLRPNKDIDPQTKCDLDFSLTLTMMLLLAPLGWIYYFPLLFVPFIVLFKIANHGYQPLTLRLVTCVAIILTSIPYPLVLPKFIIGPTIVFLNAGVYFYALVLLCGLLYFAQYTLRQPIHSRTENISQELIILLYIIAFLPSLIGFIGIANSFTANKALFMPKIEMIQPLTKK